MRRMGRSLEPIADALVLVFTRGVSLQSWRHLGLLEREWALYARLAPAYARTVLVTYGSAEDGRIGEELGAEVVCNEGGLDDARFEGAAPGQVGEVLSGSREVVIKTNQMRGGTLGVQIAHALRARSIRTGLVARGGYLWSRFEAVEHGPGSVQAIEAGKQEQELCAAADIIVGTSVAMVGDLSWRYAISRERTRLIPNYVLGELPVRGAAEREQGTILYAGQLVARKRVDLIIEAAALVKDINRRAVRVSIIGEGPEEDRLRALAEAKGVDATFEARLAHRTLLERMASCAVYVQASALEGHPKTVLEAMSTGAPVIVTESPGLGGLIDHGSSGLVFPADPSAIARGIAGMLDDPSWAEAMGEAASANVLAKFGLDRIVVQEHEAHSSAMKLAGKGRAVAPEPVRWDPSLLEAPSEEAVGAWARSLRGFARRLPNDRVGAFLMGLDGPTYELQGEMAVRAGGGLHPKHRVTRYHDFFVERVKPGWRVVDLGCGNCALACAIAAAGATVVGMEISEANACQARARIEGEGLSSRVEVVMGDIREHRLDGTFDAIVLSNVLEHVRDRPALLRQWVAWYEPRRVLIRVPAFDRDWRVGWKRELGVEWRLDLTHETEYVRAKLEAEMREGGLAIEEVVTTWGEYWVDARPS